MKTWPTTVEKAFDSLPGMTSAEWARLAILCLDQAGCSVQYQDECEQGIKDDLRKHGKSA